MSFRVGVTRTIEGRLHLSIEQWEDMKCTATVRIFPHELVSFIRKVIEHSDNILHMVGVFPLEESRDK